MLRAARSSRLLHGNLPADRCGKVKFPSRARGRAVCQDLRPDSPQGRRATKEDVALIRKAVGPTMGNQGFGRRPNMDDALSRFAAGATRIGTSGGIGIMKGETATKCINCGRCKEILPDWKRNHSPQRILNIAQRMRLIRFV